MRRDVGCDERDAGLVEGRQGHDPGSTIGADNMRPLTEMPGSEDRMAHSLRGHSRSWLPGIPFGGR